MVGTHALKSLEIKIMLKSDGARSEHTFLLETEKIFVPQRQESLAVAVHHSQVRERHKV